MTTLYTIGRSTRNTVKVTAENGKYRVTLTESGGQYNQLCADLDGIVEYLGRMWGYGESAMTASEMRAKVKAKLRLALGPDLFDPA